MVSQVGVNLSISSLIDLVSSSHSADVVSRTRPYDRSKPDSKLDFGNAVQYDADSGHP
jgi:hypothetical protein